MGFGGIIKKAAPVAAGVLAGPAAGLATRAALGAISKMRGGNNGDSALNPKRELEAAASPNGQAFQNNLAAGTRAFGARNELSNRIQNQSLAGIDPTIKAASLAERDNASKLQMEQFVSSLMQMSEQDRVRILQFLLNRKDENKRARNEGLFQLGSSLSGLGVTALSSSGGGG